MNPKILDIPLKKIREIIPDNLMELFMAAKFNTIRDVLEYSALGFYKLPTASVRTEDLFINFKSRVVYQSEEIYFYYLKNTLALDEYLVTFATESASFLELYKKLAVAYINTLKDNFLRELLFHTYGFGVAQLTLTQIGSKYNYSYARSVQYKKLVLINLKQAFKGAKLPDSKFTIPPYFVHLSNKIVKKISHKSFKNIETIEAYFTTQLHETFDEEKHKILRLFLEVNDIKTTFPTPTPIASKPTAVREKRTIRKPKIT
ncbi:MAG: hypothetical protein WCQ95_13120 [Bacteroidota bacterium]